MNLLLLWDKEMENQIDEQCGEDAGEDPEDDISESKYPGGDLHPLSEAAKDTADHRSAM
jgi:hypothetical protein